MAGQGMVYRRAGRPSPPRRGGLPYPSAPPGPDLIASSHPPPAKKVNAETLGVSNPKQGFLILDAFFIILYFTESSCDARVSIFMVCIHIQIIAPTGKF